MSGIKPGMSYVSKWVHCDGRHARQLENKTNNQEYDSAHDLITMTQAMTTFVYMCIYVMHGLASGPNIYNK